MRSRSYRLLSLLPDGLVSPALITLYLVVANLFCGCRDGGPRGEFDRSTRDFVIRQVGRLPAVVDESSGVVPWTDSTFLTHNDDGPPHLYEVTYRGRLLGIHSLEGWARNRDWEALARDSAGQTVYACDVGNNYNRRQDLTIYPARVQRPARWPATDSLPPMLPAAPTFEGPDTARVIRLRYGRQRDFPPRGRRQDYDAEAVTWHRGQLWVFSKHRGSRRVYHYALPAQPGAYTLYPQDSAYLYYPITGADVSPDGRTLALLGYGMVYLYDLEDYGQRPAGVFGWPLACIRLARAGQAEAIWWRGNDQLYVTNEQGRIFSIVPKRTLHAR